MLPLLLLSLAFSYAVFQKGGVWPQDWNISLLILGLLALFYRPRTPVPRLEPWLRWPLILLPAYAAFQLLPLPIPLLRLLSPARAEIQAALGGNFAPLSVVPAATLRHFLRIAVYVLVFLLVRELAWRLSRRPWSLAFPLVAIAALEAALGLVQFYSKASEAVARGTYVNRNHYAGLLEMSLPFALMYPVAVLRRNRSPDHSPVRPALIACAVLALAALILLGIIHSLSRMGFIAALVSLFVCGTAILLQTARYKLWSASRKLLVVLFVAALILLGFIFLPPDQLIARFGQLAFSDGITSQDRLQLWRETLPLIAAYPLFGCGLGGYESAFMKYKISEPMFRDDYAHNDYLQYLAELGTIGFLIAAALIVAVVLQAARAAGRTQAVACLAAFAAILLHSTVDFNLYIPANAMLLAWISGISVSLMFSSNPAPAWRPRGLPQVIELEPASPWRFLLASSNQLR